MKLKSQLTISLFFSLALILLFGSNIVFASGLERLNGRLLLQVEDRGKAWYVNPNTGTRAYLGSQENALRVVRSFGVGINNVNLNKIDIDKIFAKKLSGKIFMQVEAHGEAWYVNPVDLNKYYLGKPADMYEVMKKLSLGITNNDLNKISVMLNYGEGDSVDNIVITPVVTSTPPIVLNPTSTPPITQTPICSAWTYSEWTSCDASKLQSRTVISYSPLGCVGGQPVVSQACELSFNVNFSAANTPLFTVTDKASTEILYMIENTSKISNLKVNGITFENNLDSSGSTYYYDKTYLTVYDAQNKILANKNLVNNQTNDLIFNEGVNINSQSTTTLRVVVSGFGGDLNSAHLITRLINVTLDSVKAVLNGLPVDSNIYRR